MTEDVAIDPGGARKRGTVKIPSCSPQTRGGGEGGASPCVSSRQRDLMKSWRLRREKEGHPGCQGRAAAHYCGGVPSREGGGGEEGGRAGSVKAPAAIWAPDDS